jgi:hypothetical protein
MNMKKTYRHTGSLNKEERRLLNGLALFVFTYATITLLALTAPIQMANALPTQDEIIADIYEEADKINDIMNQKIENHPGLSDVDGHCYNSIEALEKCQKDVAEEMEPYYEDTGKRLSDKLD